MEQVAAAVEQIAAAVELAEVKTYSSLVACPAVVGAFAGRLA